MSKPIVRCRCGHQVLGREILRTQPCEKPSGAEAVYVKFRCRRCKKLGESFIPHDEWNPDIFDVPHDEMKVEERDRFIGADAIGSGDVISFHRALQKAGTLSELLKPDAPKDSVKTEARRKSDKRAGKDTAREGDKPLGDKSSGDKPPHRSRGGN